MLGDNESPGCRRVYRLLVVIRSSGSMRDTGTGRHAGLHIWHPFTIDTVIINQNRSVFAFVTCLKIRLFVCLFFAGKVNF